MSLYQRFCTVVLLIVAFLMLAYITYTCNRINYQLDAITNFHRLPQFQH
jgi:hypothetical protein